ncbi:MAG: hypothetical protein V3U57_07275 [Robiginitomaculum sp.]
MAFAIIPTLISLAAGAAGGNIAGALTKSGMGVAGRSVTGIAGGFGLAQILPMIPGIGNMLAPLGGIGSGVVLGGVGGLILTFILGKVMGTKT